jgi:predicted nucleic acid-binding protein
MRTSEREVGRVYPLGAISRGSWHFILATARAHGATLWTQDADFASFPGVRYFAAR